MDLDVTEVKTAVRSLRHKVEALRRAGIRRYRKPSDTGATLPPPASAAAPAQDAPVRDSTDPVAVSRDVDPTPALIELAAVVRSCTRCSELAQCRTQTVFGVGSHTAELCFVGEAPGADEDAQGEPFVGAAGKLLTRIIGAMGLARSDVYICNVLKCRPPGNRPPEPDEIANCREYLERQLELIRPKYICALGAHAAKTLLNSTQSIGRLRGRLHDYRGTPVLCTYHPAYLLRSPEAKKDVWEDMQILMREMGLAQRANSPGESPPGA